MEYLVTGGAGFIGARLARRLVALHPGRVRVLDDFTRTPISALELERDGLDVVRADVRCLSELRNAMVGCRVVFHLAAIATVMSCEGDPDSAFAVNAGGTLNVLTAARELGVRRVVFASSREVYGEPSELPVTEGSLLRPKNTYGASKAAAETLCASFAAAGLEVTALRLSNVFGPGDRDRVIPRFILSARAGDALTVYGGMQLVDFIWVDRAVETFVRAATGGYVRGSVNVGSGIGVTILEAARRVVERCGSGSQVQLLPTRDVEVSRFVADISRATRELGLVRPDDPLAELGFL
jgi:UDP-glucose 4-epimerase